MKLALLLFLTLTTFCLSSVDNRSETNSMTSKMKSASGKKENESNLKSKTSKMKSFSGKEENEEGLILVDDMWLDRDDLDWEEEGGREGRHGVKSKRRLWPRKKVPRGFLYYKISKEFNRKQRREIQGVIEGLEKKLEQCVFFKRLDVKSKRKDFVHVKPSKKTCSSEVGYRGKRQTVKLAPWCIKRGAILHEFMHALGAQHTHMRRDRDKYVKIYMRNIPKEKRKNYYKKSEGFSNYSLPYDFDSIMHYPAKDRIETRKKKYQKRIGQRQGLSKGDVELIKRMYKCN